MKYRSHISTLIICWLLTLCACFKPDDYDNINPDKVLQVVSDNVTAAADGISTAEIKVQLNDDASISRRKVIFKSTLGSFRSGAGDSLVLEANSDRIATANLLSTRTGVATVKAIAQSFTATRQIKVTFINAYPDNINVAVDSFVIHPTFHSEVLITANLSKTNGGKPSVGHRVDFSVVDRNGNTLGSFLNNQSFSTTNSDGRASIRYSAGITSIRGPVTIIASTLKEDSSILTATTQIFITD